MAIDKFLDSNTVQTEDMDIAKGYIMVRADRKHIKVGLANILYIEGLKDYVKIIMADQVIITKESIGNFLQRLSQNHFIRIHKSFIVAIDKITAVTAYDIEIGKIEIPIGRKYKEQLMLRLKTKS